LSTPRISPPGQVALRTEGLTKRFGTLTAVDDLALEVRRGEVVGLLGPNGAGKSTTIGMILGLIAPTAGRALVAGIDVRADPAAALAGVGAIAEVPAFYPYLSGRDNLVALALIRGGDALARVDPALARVGLADRARSPFRTYSLGMRQRLGLASTLIADPALVILDEPTNGLDPAGQREIRGLVRELATEGHAVLLASHLLHDVQQVCDRVIVIHHGRLVMAGTIAQILARAGGYCVEVDELDRAAAVLRSLPFVRDVRVDGTILAVAADERMGSEINRTLAHAGIYAEAIERRQTSLEEVFLELTEGPRAPVSS
jgi:ABC-2 type transport system ATP-binding protein